MRVGTKQKKVNVDMPVLEDFIHKVYVNVARKVYTNVYLFELGISALKSQKNSRELEIIIRECILQTIRDNIPVEELLKLYMSETVEDAMEVHEREEIISQEPIIEKPVAGNISNPASSLAEAETISKIKAASAAASSSQLSGVSFNMKNNEVISIENTGADSNNNFGDDDNNDDDSEYNDYMNDDNNDDDDENVKLSIGENVELSVDPFPVDGGDDGNDSDVDIKIDSIPPLDL
jgi:hypothetical protein